MPKMAVNRATVRCTKFARATTYLWSKLFQQWIVPGAIGSRTDSARRRAAVGSAVAPGRLIRYAWAGARSAKVLRRRPPHATLSYAIPGARRTMTASGRPGRIGLIARRRAAAA